MRNYLTQSWNECPFSREQPNSFWLTLGIILALTVMLFAHHQEFQDQDDVSLDVQYGEVTKEEWQQIYDYEATEYKLSRHSQIK